MNHLIAITTSFVLVACAANSGQIGTTTPNGQMHATVSQDANGGQHWAVKVDTKQAYEDCLRKFQGVPTAPGTCQAEADKALQEGLAAAGAAVGKPLGQGSTGPMGPYDLQTGYAMARQRMSVGGASVWLPMPPSMPMPMPAPQQHAAPQQAESSKPTKKEFEKAVVDRLKDHERRLTQIEGGK